ncbi:MAG: hypothetical protein AAFZ15_10595 [Bacteroidota bacterium]
MLNKNTQGAIPAAVARSNDNIGDPDLRITNLDLANLIRLGSGFMVELNDGSTMRDLTCRALNVGACTATFNV